MKTNRAGFTLIEMAIVLVIVGLLLGGVLKGQELITSARVRNLISQQDGIKAAYFGFQDRYRALPGDYAQATININGATRNGNGNGQVELAATPVNGSAPEEYILAWEHLSRSGFINGSYTFAASVADTTTPKNPYSAHLQLIYDNNYGTGTPAARHNLKTGNQVPVNILAEVDLKIDDGNPYGGTFQFSPYGGPAATCVDATTNPVSWNIKGDQNNCGGTSVF